MTTSQVCDYLGALGHSHPVTTSGPVSSASRPRGDFWGAEGAAFCRWTRRSRNETCSYVVVDLKNVELVVIHVNRARFWTERHCAMLNCVEFDRTADARSEPPTGRHDVRRRAAEPFVRRIAAAPRRGDGQRVETCPGPVRVQSFSRGERDLVPRQGLPHDGRDPGPRR